MRTETILIIVMVVWLVLGLVMPLSTEDPPIPTKDFQPPGRELFVRDSEGNLIPPAPEEPVEHPEFR